MAYLPKSKVKVKNTPGGEFIYKLTKKDYMGSFIETSDGKFVSRLPAAKADSLL